MRDKPAQTQTLVFGLVALAIIGVGYSLAQQGKLPGFSATPTAVCGNLVCQIGENSMNCPTDCKAGQTPVATAVCGNGACEASESASSCPADCQISAGLTCPSDATTSYEVNVRDVLNESAYNRLSVTVKKISDSGNLIDEQTSSSSASTIMKVPCAKSTNTLIAYDDDNSGIDIYPAEVKINAYTVENGALAGGRIPVTINAKQQGTLDVTAYDSSGTATDINITITAGETNPYTRLMITETEDDKAAENVMCMINYTTTKFKKLEWNGYSPAGLTATETAVPSIWAGDGGFEKAWNIFLNGKPLTLDGDSRTSDPDRVYFDVTIYTYADTDPGGSHNVTFRCVDRMKYWEADGVTWANGGQPSAQDANSANLGIAATAEGYNDVGLEYY